ncbi:LysE family transporter [Flavobacterium sp. MAH-1]|uniref:LysE family transporter n=1 Tax=Flavobacterium agri TaxID=2743471 RepID=A0A7Y9C5P8_9FLAO|nr:LysE family transporter [Flavobacterium agri]NUY80615.1 LysE family transporter [Flavobacterium agri]NYA70639.1 LysE family transporter [Flavobacterium agri]
MQYILSMFMGLFASIAGIMPPGLLNMTAVKINRNEGHGRAFVFALGAALMLAFHSFLAVVFAKFLDRHPEIIILLREAGLAVFTGLTLYFFFFAKSSAPKNKEVKFRSKKSRFFWGLLLSGLNFFTIPFYVFVSLTLASYNLFSFEMSFVLSFVFGILVGTLFGFYCFVTFFEKMQNRTAFIVKHMNYVIGSVTGLIALITLCNVIQYYN